MTQTEYCKIVDKLWVNKDIVVVRAETQDIGHQAIPGQFVALYLDIGLLPRPYSICNVDGNIVSLMFQVKGKGTKMHSEVKLGDTVRMLGSLGNGFPAFNNKKLLLIGGGLGVAPLLFYSQYYDNDVKLIYGARSQEYFVYPLVDKSDYKVDIHEIIGYPTPYIKSIIDDYDAILTCGPQMMMDKICNLGQMHDKRVYMSTEAHMACCIGACLCCVIELDGEYKRVCVDGPVFKR